MALTSTKTTSVPGTILRVSLVLLLVAVVVVTSAFFFAYGMEPDLPGEAEIVGLHGQAAAGLGPGGLVVAEGATAPDAFAALGYAHAARYAWTMTLWREAALGRMAQWQGDTLLALDRLTHTLALESGARRAWDGLDSLGRANLTAYARGVDAGLREETVASGRQMLLSGAEPDTWEPWHSLAVERLLAWLATDPPAAELDAQDRLAEPGLEAFAEADRQLRSALHLHGLSESYAAIVTDSMGTRLFARIAYGAAATPYAVPTRMRIGQAEIAGASFPGFPALIVGQTPSSAFAVLPRGTARIERIAAVPLDSLDDSSPLDYHRIESASGDEVLLALRRVAEGVLLTAPDRPVAQPDSLVRDSTGRVRAIFAAPVQTAATDSAWALRWDGLAAGSDLAAWHGLLSVSGLGTPGANFGLIRGDGIGWTEGGAVRRMGEPMRAATWTGERSGTLVSNSAWADWLATALQRRDSLETDPSARLTDVASDWAAAWVPDFVARLASSGLSPVQEEALTYLANWDYRYEPGSVAATLADYVYAETQERPDSLRPALGALPTFSQAQALGEFDEALVQLTLDHGITITDWRWTTAFPTRRPFPLWTLSGDMSSREDMRGAGRYAPLEVEHVGHPSTLRYGAAPLLAAFGSTNAALRFYTSDAPNTAPVLDLPYFDDARLLARYLATDTPSRRLALRDADIQRIALSPTAE